MPSRRVAAALGAASLVAAAAAVPVGATPSAAPSVNVTLKDFKFVLSTSSAKKGAVVFKLKNAGKAPHDMKIAGKKSALLAPGQSGKLAVTFSKAGKYAFLCTVPGHAQLGMKGTFTVK